MSKALAELPREQLDAVTAAIARALQPNLPARIPDLDEPLDVNDLAPAVVAVLELLADRTEATATARAVLIGLLADHPPVTPEALARATYESTMAACGAPTNELPGMWDANVMPVHQRGAIERAERVLARAKEITDGVIF